VLDQEKPLFQHDVEQTLFSLAGERAISMDTGHAKRLESWVNFSIKRPLDMSLTSTITRSLFQGKKIDAEYFSISSGSQRRELSPTALVHDGLRWHVRCFDHAKNQFRDFSLSRFKSAVAGSYSSASQANDKEWNTEVQLKLVPHPRLEHPDAIKIDYGMDDGYKFVPVRACIAGYFLRHWPIDCSDDACDDPKKKQLYLANKQELREFGVPDWAFS
jgi:predicted DNA-binding transcriptional regulator YafY